MKMALVVNDSAIVRDTMDVGYSKKELIGTPKDNALKMKILLIDDNKAIDMLLGSYFKIKGHQCTVVNDGRKGLALILEKKFDVILLDLAMPEFSGIDVINSLEKNGKLKGNKIIVLTALSMSDMEIKGLMQKGIWHIKKPVALDVLVKIIEKINKKQLPYNL